MAGNRATFFVATNATTFARKSPYTNIPLADCAWVLDGTGVKLNIPRENERESYKGIMVSVPNIHHSKSPKAIFM